MSKKKIVNSGGFAGGGLISFSDVSDVVDDRPKNRYVTSTESNMSVAYTGSDPTLVIACKRVLKKDINTKLKSIAEINQVLAASKDVDESIIKDFMPFFTFAFSKLLFDDSIQVRMGLANILTTVCEVNRKSLAPVMDGLIGGWWQLMSDPSVDVKQAFKVCFYTAFPPKRRDMVIQHLSKRIFEHCLKTATMTTTELKALTQCAEDELQDKYDRVVISSLGGLTDLLDQLSSSELENRLFDEDHKLQRISAIQDLIRLHASTNTIEIKTSLSHLISYLMEKYPEALRDSVDTLRNYCLENLRDTSATLESTFQLLVAISSKWPSFYDKGGLLANIITKISGLCRSSLPDIHERTLEFLLPFVGTVSSTKLGIFVEKQDATVTVEGQKKHVKLMKSFLAVLAEEIALACEDVNGSTGKSSYVQRQVRVLECAVFLLLRKLPDPLTGPSVAFDKSNDRVEELLNIIRGGIVNVLKALAAPETTWRRNGSQNSETINTNTMSFVKTLFVLQRSTNQGQVLSNAEWNSLLWQVVAKTVLTLQGTDSRLEPLSLKLTELIRNYLFVNPDATQQISWTSGVFGATIANVLCSSLEGTNGSSVQDRMLQLQHSLSTLELLTTEPFPSPVDPVIVALVTGSKSQWLSLLVENSTVMSEFCDTASTVLWSIIDSPNAFLRSLIVTEELLDMAVSIGNAKVLFMILSAASGGEQNISDKFVPMFTKLFQMIFTVGTSLETISAEDLHVLGVKLINDLRLSTIEIRIGILMTIWQSSMLNNNELLSTVLRNWNEPNCSTVCFWFVATLGAICSTLEGPLQEQVGNLLREKLFVSRLLNQLVTPTDVAHVPTTPAASTVESIFYRAKIISSIGALKEQLLPRLPDDVIECLLDKFQSQIEDSLPNLLSASSDNINERTKWTNQFLSYIELVSNHYPSNGFIVSNRLPVLFQANFWREEIEKLSSDHNQLVLMLILWSDILKSVTYLDTVHHAKWISVSLLIHVIIAIYAASMPPFVAFDLGSVLADMMQLISSAGYSTNVTDYLLHEYIPMCSLVETEAFHFLFASLLSSIKKSDGQATRLYSLHLALDANRCSRGQRIWYLTRSAESTTNSQTILSLTEALIKGIHLENGPEQPYYTIELVGAEDGQRRELQTEWWRVQLLTDDSAAQFQLSDQVDASTSLSCAFYLPQVYRRFQHNYWLLQQSLSLLFVREWCQHEESQEWLHSQQSSVLTQWKQLVSSATSSRKERAEAEETIQNMLLLIPLLVRFDACASSSLWLQEVVAWLYHELLQQQATRMAHDVEYLISRMRFVSELLSVVSASCTLDIIAEKKLIPAALSLLRSLNEASEEYSMLYAGLVALLATLCQRQGAQRVAATDLSVNIASGDLTAGLFPVRTWEPAAFVMLTTSIFRSGAELQHRCDLMTKFAEILAVQGALLGRNQNESTQLLTVSTFSADEWPEEWAKVAFAVESTSNVSNYASILSDSKRLLAGKLLDVYVAHEETVQNTWSLAKPFLLNQGNDSTDGNEGMTSVSGCEEDGNDEDLSERELLERDRRVLQAVLLSVADPQSSKPYHAQMDWINYLQERFAVDAIISRSYLVTANRSSSSSAAAADEIEDDDDEEGDSNDQSQDEDNHNNTSGASSPFLKSKPQSPKPVSSPMPGKPSQSQITPPRLPSHHHSHSQQHVRRLCRQLLVHYDPLGSLLLWITTLQAIDAGSKAGPSRNSLRAQCGTFLQKTGFFAEAMTMLLTLAGDALTKSTAASSGGSTGAGWNSNLVAHSWQGLLHLLPSASTTYLSEGRAVSSSLVYQQHLQSLTSLASMSAPGGTISGTSSASASAFASLGQQRTGDCDVFKVNNATFLDPRVKSLAVYALYRTVLILPAMTRAFWSSDHCSRGDKLRLSKFVEEKIRTHIIRREIALIEASTHHKPSGNSLAPFTAVEDTLTTVSATGDNFSVTGNAKTGQITASLVQDEVAIDITISLPPAYPLKNVDVSCTRRIGVTEARWRRWVLQMIQLLSMQDGAVMDAALLWRSNITQELQGIEPCPICYCTLHTKTLKLPTFACPTCKHRFHPSCLHTWFKTSGKNKCVLCQQPISL